MYALFLNITQSPGLPTSNRILTISSVSNDALQSVFLVSAIIVTVIDYAHCNSGPQSRAETPIY